MNFRLLKVKPYSSEQNGDVYVSFFFDEGLP